MALFGGQLTVSKQLTVKCDSYHNNWLNFRKHLVLFCSTDNLQVYSDRSSTITQMLMYVSLKLFLRWNPSNFCTPSCAKWTFLSYHPACSWQAGWYHSYMWQYRPGFWNSSDHHQIQKCVIRFYCATLVLIVVHRLIYSQFWMSCTLYRMWDNYLPHTRSASGDLIPLKFYRWTFSNTGGISGDSVFPILQFPHYLIIHLPIWIIIGN